MDMLADISFLAKGLYNAVASPLGLNVVGGLLASIVALSSSWVLDSYRRRLRGRRFKHIFGPGSGHTLVYGALALRYEALNRAFDLPAVELQRPYIKPGGDPRFGFSISQPVSIAEVRAANYLASSIGKFAGVTPTLRSDQDVRTNLDLDFISFGGPASNLKSADCQTNEGNRMARFDQESNRFVSPSDSQQSLQEFDPSFDYGMILKVRPTQFPSRVWISCMGRGEWSTSGAAWFLANKWDQLEKLIGDQPFAAFVRVRPGQDESAEPVKYVVGRNVVPRITRDPLARPDLPARRAPPNS